MRAGWSRALGDSAEARRAFALVGGSLADTSVRTYSSHWNTFVRFCGERGLCALPAAPSTLVLYTAWHSSRRTVQPQSFQPYLSAINSAHRHVLGETSVPNGGGLLKAVRRGWLREHLATPGVQKDVTMALPAVAARAVLTRFMQLAAAPAEQRAHTFTVLSFGTLMRASSAVPLADTDVVDVPAELRVRPRRIKGGQLSVLLPIPKVFPFTPSSAYMALAVRRWRAIRDGAWRAQTRERAPGPDELGSFWALPGDAFSLAAAASVATAWVSQALALAGVKAPPHVQYTSKCNRKGGASAAYAEGVGMEAIWALGDWAIGSTTPAKHYIDAAVRSDEHSNFFFGFRAMRRTSS